MTTLPDETLKQWRSFKWPNDWLFKDCEHCARRSSKHRLTELLEKKG